MDAKYSLLSISEQDLNQAAHDCPYHPNDLVRRTKPRRNMIIEVEAKNLTPDFFPEGTDFVPHADIIKGTVNSVRSREENCDVTWHTEPPTEKITYPYATLMLLEYQCPEDKGYRIVQGQSWASTPVTFGNWGMYTEGQPQPTRTPLEYLADFAKIGLDPTEQDFLLRDTKALHRLYLELLHKSGKPFKSIRHYLLDTDENLGDDFNHNLATYFKNWVLQSLAPIVRYHFKLPVFPRERSPSPDIHPNEVMTAEAKNTKEESGIENGISLLLELAGSQVQGTGFKDGDGGVEGSKGGLGVLADGGGANVGGGGVCSVGDAVQVRVRDGEWYDAVVAEVREDGMYVMRIEAGRCKSKAAAVMADAGLGGGGEARCEPVDGVASVCAVSKKARR